MCPWLHYYIMVKIYDTYGHSLVYSTYLRLIITLEVMTDKTWPLIFSFCVCQMEPQITRLFLNEVISRETCRHNSTSLGDKKPEKCRRFDAWSRFISLIPRDKGVSSDGQWAEVISATREARCSERVIFYRPAEPVMSEHCQTTDHSLTTRQTHFWE